MHKLILLILLLICNITYSQQVLDTLKVENYLSYSDSTDTFNKVYSYITLGNENLEKRVSRFYDGRPERLDKLTYKTGNVIDSTIIFTKFQKIVEARVDDNTTLKTVYRIKSELTPLILESKALYKQLDCGYKRFKTLYFNEDLTGKEFCIGRGRSRGKHIYKYYCNGKLVMKDSRKYTSCLIPTKHIYKKTTDSHNIILTTKNSRKKLGLTSYYCLRVYSYQDNLIKKERIESGRHKRKKNINEITYDYNDSLCIRKIYRLSKHSSNELYTNEIHEYKYDNLGRVTDEIYYEYSYLLKELVKRRKKEIVYYD